jgi:parallel beta-helix repeat protein
VFNPGYRFGTADDYSNLAAPVAGQGIPGQARIDGFTLSGSKAGGGIYVVTRARGLEITNNEITNNQGNYAGGISVSVPDAGFQMFDVGDFRQHVAGFQNTEVLIKNNKIHKNGGFQGAGGIGIGEDTHNYRVEKNLITGNYSSFHGGGFAHLGMSDNGLIKDNRILFNENFFGAILQRAGDGGGIYIGGDIAGGTGAGSVTIDGNLIQGNMTGSGSGGGIRAANVSGEDVRAIAPNGGPPEIIGDIPNPWPLYTLRIVNNIIVNNIAGLDGGGISLQDVSRSVIVNNTIANNDSTSVSVRAFPAGETSSTPNPGGISSRPHSAILNSLWAAAETSAVPEFAGGAVEPAFSNPLLQNNILWHNRSWYFNGAAAVPALAPNPSGQYWELGVIGGTGMAMSCTSCLLSGGANPLFESEYVNQIEAARVIDEGGNNINIRFTPLELGTSNYHIAAGSPAINAGGAVSGLQAPLPALLALDFDDGPRPAGGGVDIGADEYLSAAPVNLCPADLNGDRVVNFADLAILRANFGTTCVGGPGCPGDVNLDGSVNFADLATLRAEFGKSCP